MSCNIAVIYTGGLEAIAGAFGEAATHLAARVRMLSLADEDQAQMAAGRPAPDRGLLEWADGIAFGTPVGDGRPNPALMTFLETTEPLWNSGRLCEKVVTVFTDEPERIAPDSVLHPIYDALYLWGAVIVGPRALEAGLDTGLGHGPLEHGSHVPVSKLRATQSRAVRLARLAGVVAEERHRRERLLL